MAEKAREYEEKDVRLLAQDCFDLEGDYYKLVTFLNQSLKHKDLIFGISRQDERLSLRIYEVNGKEL